MAAPSPARMPRPRRGPLFALFTANAISMVGNVLTLIAVPWFVLQTTGSAAQTGITAFCETLATVLAAFLGGALVDRLGHRRSSILADITSGLAVAAIPTLRYTAGLALWQLLALVFLAAFFNTPGTTARSALLPDLAGLAGVRLERANATAQAIQRGATLAGAPLAGVLVAIIGTSRLLWVDAATFAVSALLIGLRVPGRAPGGAPHASGRYLAELADGLRFIRANRLVRAVVLAVMLTNFLDAPFFAVILPVLAQRQFGSALALGLAMAAFGAGSLLGAVLYGAIGHRLPRHAMFVWLFFVLGLRFWVLALLPPLPVLLTTLAVTGLASGPINPLLGTVGQERVPEALRGRVFGAITAGAWVAMPLSIIAAGYLIELVDLRVTLVATAAAYLLVTVGQLLSPALREMDLPIASEPAMATSPTAAQPAAEAVTYET